MSGIEVLFSDPQAALEFLAPAPGSGDTVVRHADHVRAAVACIRRELSVLDEARIAAVREAEEAEDRCAELQAKLDNRTWWEGVYDDRPLTQPQIEAELSDFRMVMDIASKVYCTATGGRISKVNTDADCILSEIEARTQEAIDEAVKDEREAWELEDPIARREAPRIEFHQQDFIPGFAAFLPDLTGPREELEVARHVKSNRRYEVLGEAIGQVSTPGGLGSIRPPQELGKARTPVTRVVMDDTRLTIYRDPRSGRMFWRFPDEFADGRFEPVSPPGTVSKAFCVLNVGSALAAVHTGDIPRDEIPYMIAESMMHEVIHVLEQWAGVAFSEDRIEVLLDGYRARYKGEGAHGDR